MTQLFGHSFICKGTAMWCPAFGGVLVAGKKVHN